MLADRLADPWEMWARLMVVQKVVLKVAQWAIQKAVVWAASMVETSESSSDKSIKPATQECSTIPTLIGIA